MMFPRLLRAAASMLTLAAMAVPAFAHAHPKTMSPAANAAVEAPKEISMTFSEAVDPKFSSIELTRGTSTLVSKSATVADPANHTHLTLPLPPLTPGAYVVHWVSAAVDGHRMDGTYSFTVK